MKVLLLSIKAADRRKCINKDLAGGMGTGTWAGDSIRARVFEWVKKKNVVLPEIATVYLAAIFKKNGWSVKFLNEVDETNIPAEAADLVLIPVSIVDCEHERQVIKRLKKQGYYIGVYGTFASVMPGFFLGEADFAIKGEPEAGALKIVAANNLPRGILAVEPVADLDDLPFPDWRQFPIEKYSYSPALNRRPLLSALTSRGCPYSCSYYCPYPINSGKKWRIRSVDNVLAELEYLVNEFGARAIDFRDPIFTFNRSRTINFARQLINKKFNLIWSCETRADCLDKELLVIMHQAGLRHLNLGVESVNEEVLKKSRRLPIKIIQQEEMISCAHKIGITVAAFYIIGLEHDTEKTVRQTINYSKKLNTLVAQFTIGTPYPGTQFFARMKEENRLTTFDWPMYDAYNPVYQHQFLSSSELLRLKEKAFVGYYFRSSYLLKHMPKFFKEKIYESFNHRR